MRSVWPRDAEDAIDGAVEMDERARDHRRRLPRSPRLAEHVHILGRARHRAELGQMLLVVAQDAEAEAAGLEDRVPAARVSASEISTRGGLAEIEQQALIVRPQSRSPLRAITITTPAASERIADLNVSSSTLAGRRGAKAGSASM